MLGPLGIFASFCEESELSVASRQNELAQSFVLPYLLWIAHVVDEQNRAGSHMDSQS